MKIPISNKKLWGNFLKIASGISVVITTILAFVDFCPMVKYIVGGVFLGVLFGLFVILLFRANKMEHLTLQINNSTVNIRFASIFEQTDLKVITLTSHNTYLMQNKLTRPDCCYIMTQNKITSLFNSTSKEIREAHNLEKMYINGAFNE